jgi:hypothetical protein
LNRRSDADLGIAIDVETPLEGGTDIIDAGKCGTRCAPVDKAGQSTPVCSSHRR